MSIDIDFDPVPPDVEAHLRRTLQVVATSVRVPAAPAERSAEGRGRSHRRRRGRTVVAAVAVAVSVGGLAAWNSRGPGEIERIPTEAALMSATTDGYDWWLIPAAAIGHTSRCGDPMPGVEVVSADSNKPGLEWNTMGIAYGEPVGRNIECTDPTPELDEARWLSDPAQFANGATRLGDGSDETSPWVATFAVHPTVRTINLVADGVSQQPVPTFADPTQPDGPRYAAIPLAPETCSITVELIVETEAVGGREFSLCD